MDEFIRDLLQRVHAGETTFSPDDESANAKERFQLLATAFVHAEKNGLIEGVFAHQERSTGRALFDLVRIERGLTYKGIREVTASFAS